MLMLMIPLEMETLIVQDGRVEKYISGMKVREVFFLDRQMMKDFYIRTTITTISLMKVPI